MLILDRGSPLELRENKALPQPGSGNPLRTLEIISPDTGKLRASGGTSAVSQPVSRSCAIVGLAIACRSPIS